MTNSAIPGTTSAPWMRYFKILLLAAATFAVCYGAAWAQDAPAGGAAPAATGAAADAEQTPESIVPGLIMLATVVALFVVPMFIGNYLSKSLRMPEYGWRFALAIGTLAAAAVVIAEGEIKYGPDLSGGVTLIYELQDTSGNVGEGDEPGTQRSVGEQSQLVRELISALSQRVDPSGTKEVSIREYGLGQIEIIIPKANDEELRFIQRRISTAGALAFRITASPVFSSNRQIIELAKALPPGENEVRLGGQKVAEWVAYDEREFGAPDVEDPRIVKRMAGNTPQALILTNDGLDVTGKNLKKSSVGVDEQGRPQVNFSFDTEGAFKFGQLTGKHIPNASGQEYNLGILLDNKLLSAPSIQSRITDQGRITGSMGKEEVDFIVGILNAGSLPAALNQDPISSQEISPTLGDLTVKQGKFAISVSLAAVIVFMLFYYRFAGVVACFALVANLVLILGFMVLFKAAFTLPGLAGLVLTIGMSVDANVLIFERIREERERGSALRMAIRNGFGRAFSTIVDANVTTLITGIVIYKIAPDNIKGFGVTLIIGIVMSMYSAIFLSRLVFDVVERTRKISELRMVKILGSTKFDFLGKRVLAGGLSLVLIVIGLVAVVQRGDDMLDIDFTGGSSVTMVLKDDQKMNYASVKEVLDKQGAFADKNLSLVELEESNTRYTVSSTEQDVAKVQQLLQEAFGDKLESYEVKVEEVAPLPTQTGQLPDLMLKTHFVQRTDPETDAPAAPLETPSAENSESEPAETTPADAPPQVIDPFAGGTSAKLRFGDESHDAIGFEVVRQLLQDALDASGHGGVAVSVTNPDYQAGSARKFTEWDVKVALPPAEAEAVFDKLQEATNGRPVFPLANKIGGRVAGDMKTKAGMAILVSLLGIVSYIWFRFQKVIYGFAAVLALVHDVLVTLGFLALSGSLVGSMPALANALEIEKFQISLAIVAAFLTIIGYSLNDTIVIFDRIREVKGKSPKLSAEIINTSINQTLSRTILTSFTTLITVVILYGWGGDGIHGFAYALVVGVVTGTYSTVFIASPALLWMSSQEAASPKNSGGIKAA